jgi:C-terminal processing protease CtpA/Prc
MRNLFRYAVQMTLVFAGVLTSLTNGQATAPIVNDEGGAVSITGSVRYSNPLFTSGVAQPIVILEDQAGFVDRNVSFLIPVESQTLGQITSDFFQSPFTYSITLPAVPKGSPRDVDNDDVAETGVQIFAVAYWNNTFGDPYLEERDLYGGGWSTAYASTRVSANADTWREIIGGTYLVYASDDRQGFPSSFGADGLLFTGDEPTVDLPQGYTLVNIDSDPFTFDRSANPVIDLIEGEAAGADDFSALSYSQAFDAMIAKMRVEYAFTEYKNVNWDTKIAEFRPRFADAENSKSSLDYQRALRDFALSIPDGHVGVPLVFSDIQRDYGGGLGMAIHETDDGRVLVTHIMTGGPADKAGIRERAEILTLNGLSVDEASQSVAPPNGPFSTEQNLRLEQVRWVVRFPINMKVEIKYRNAGDTLDSATTLQSVGEWESYDASGQTSSLTGFEIPVEYRLLDNGCGYAKIYAFDDNSLLTIQLWERMIQTIKNQGVGCLIIDMRQNGGGSGFLANQMAAYFFDETLPLGNSSYYDKSLGAFYADPRTVHYFFLPPIQMRYHGKIVVLVGPDCYSACEFFAYDMTKQDRATIVGQYSTGGLGGSVEDFFMPEGMVFRFTVGRAVDENDEIHIEGKGIVPTARVPVTEKTLFSDSDPVLEAAITYLNDLAGL